MEAAKPESKERPTDRLPNWSVFAPLMIVPPIAFLVAFCAVVNLIETDEAAGRKKNA
ncbi:MAG TPA: hypothetical protein V6C97_19135 [Oculatellaceae cyanobacterium]